MMRSTTVMALLTLVTPATSTPGLVTLPLIPHHEILQRRNLHVTHPGTTSIRNIPIMRRLITDDDNSNNSTASAETADDDSQHHTNDKREVGGLYQGYGTHYVDLWVGTPTAQRQTVIVDTGSGVTAFPCHDCHDCGTKYHASPFFQESQSTSFHKFTCSECSGSKCRDGGKPHEHCYLSVSYQEGSMWGAYQATDTTYIGGLHDHPLEDKEMVIGHIHGEDPLEAPAFSFNMNFGCQNKITGLFKTQLADGIAGMCIKNSALYQQMYDQKIIDNKSFSLCFARGEDAAKEGTVAGALTMGGTDTRLHNTHMVYARGLKTKAIMHGVVIRKMYLMAGGSYGVDEADTQNTKMIQISAGTMNSGSVILDSGTTDTYMTRALSGPFNAMFQEVAGFAYVERGMDLSEEQVLKLPTIIIQLEGISSGDENLRQGHAHMLDEQNPDDILIGIPPAHYIEYDTAIKKYVGRFSTTEARGSVLGANTVRGHDVFFDIVENNRVGFALSDCDYTALIGNDIPIEDLASGQGGNDEYYDTEHLSKMATDEDFDDEESKCTGTCFLMVTGFAISAVCLLVIVVYKKIKNRDTLHGNTITENQHLTDLNLDTEIQLSEIS